MGVRVGPGSAVLLEAGHTMAGPVAHRQWARVTGTMAWCSVVGLVLGSTVHTWSASAPVCLCRIDLLFRAKGNSDPEVVSVLLSGVYESLSVKLMRAVARSTLARTSRAMAEASSLAASAAARELATQ